MMDGRRRLPKGDNSSAPALSRNWEAPDSTAKTQVHRDSEKSQALFEWNPTSSLEVLDRLAIHLVEFPRRGVGLHLPVPIVIFSRASL